MSTSICTTIHVGTTHEPTAMSCVGAVVPGPAGLPRCPLLPDHGVNVCDSNALVCSVLQATHTTQGTPGTQALPSAQHLQALATRRGAGLQPPQGHPLAQGCNRSPLPLLAVPFCNSCNHCLDCMHPPIAANVQAMLLSLTKTQKRHSVICDVSTVLSSDIGPWKPLCRSVASGCRD